ncbi:hypothetical protein GIB67_010689 [Kingdonia uniflora]|uniref:RNase H type-1 domain-containing protein n=1 Tax=Kingdonia uniflora TaxID=39325 RepID=A0A7J7L8N9_9MAGN|nr:hypothetical protein GIB67_010689 [Kingdonia uniflora]
MCLAVLNYAWTVRNKTINEEHTSISAAKWAVMVQPKKPPNIKTCYWDLPGKDIMKASTDGSSRDNPGRSGCGIIIRDDTARNIRGVQLKGLGITSSYMAECHGILNAAETAYKKGWPRLFSGCNYKLQ